MNITKTGLQLIEEFEGLRLSAYKCVETEQYWTIGYGHYGADVSAEMTITPEQAEAYLKQDVAEAEQAVNNIDKGFNQNQFDALVSFTYNCGAGNLRTLCRDRDIAAIGQKLILYNKSGGNVLAGLTRRRKAEQDLYNTPAGGQTSAAAPVKTGGNDTVRAGQIHVNNFTGAGIATDGIRGADTKKAGIMVLQTGLNKDYLAELKVDGIFGGRTETALSGKNVKKGENGYMVTALEILLLLKGYSPSGVECPGVFGDNLNTAVRCYQKDKGLVVDGAAGIKTFRSLIA